MKSEQLPSYSDLAFLGDKGVRLVDGIVSDELKWIFRDLRKDDIGIDGQIEIVDKKRGATGRLLAVQIKCGDTYFSEEFEEGYIYRGEIKHLHYWLEHSLPVIVVICDAHMGICYWQEVTSSNTRLIKKTWKMIIPKSNVLSSHSKNSLTKLAGHPQHKDIIEALLHRFLYEKYIGKIEVCTLFELPRDYHKFAYLAKIKGTRVMIDFHYDMYGKVTVEDMEEIVRWKDYNDKVCGTNPLHIYIVSESKSALNLSHDVIAYLKSKKDIYYYRVLYVRDFLYDLYELDENGKAITFWPDD